MVKPAFSGATSAPRTKRGGKKKQRQMRERVLTTVACEHVKVDFTYKPVELSGRLKRMIDRHEVCCFSESGICYQCRVIDTKCDRFTKEAKMLQRCAGAKIADEISKRRQKAEYEYETRFRERKAHNDGDGKGECEYSVDKPAPVYAAPFDSVEFTPDWARQVYLQVMAAQKKNGCWTRDGCIEDASTLITCLADRCTDVPSPDTMFMFCIEQDGSIDE